MARILGDGKRQRTHAFTELVSHYLFEDRFGRLGKGNDKGKVEALAKYSRANFLTPVPHAPSFEAVNAALEERCRVRQAERAGRHEQTIGERLVADQAVLRPLPEAPFEPCDKAPGQSLLDSARTLSHATMTVGKSATCPERIIASRPHPCLIRR